MNRDFYDPPKHKYIYKILAVLIFICLILEFYLDYVGGMK